MRVNCNGRYEERMYEVYNRARTNNDLVENYMGYFHNDCQTNNHWYYSNLFVSYNTPIAYKIGKHVICNAQRYSTTTTTIQNKVIGEALHRGYQVHYVEVTCFFEMIYNLEFGINDDLYFNEYEEFLDSLDNPLNLSMDDCKYLMSIDLESEATV